MTVKDLHGDCLDPVSPGRPGRPEKICSDIGTVSRFDVGGTVSCRDRLKVNDENGPAGAMLSRFLETEDWFLALKIWLGQRRQAGLTLKAMLALLSHDIAMIDEMITDQVNVMLHHPVFQKLEASWRGLQYLVEEADADRDRMVRVRVLAVTWTELSQDVRRAVDVDQTMLFRKVYEEEFGVAGGIPFGVLIGDYEIQHRPSPGHPVDDLDVLESIAHTAASAFAPFIAGAAPSLLGLQHHGQLERQIDLHRLFGSLEYQKWNDFRRQPDARYVGLTLPRVLIRKPYGDQSATVIRRQCLDCGSDLRGVRGRCCQSCGRVFDIDQPRTFRSHRLGFRFEERVQDLDRESYLWANGAYAFAGVLIRTFIDYAWLADIRGFDHDGSKRGIVTGLAVDEFGLDRQGTVPKMSAAVMIDSFLEADLADHGLIPLCHSQGTSRSVFYSNRSVYKPVETTDTQCAVQERISAMLQYTLCVSRFAHYLKVQARDYIGSKKSAHEVENRLIEWVNRYVAQDDQASIHIKAKFPLRNAEVKVRQMPDRPGQFQCQMRLWPHYQLDDLSVAVRLVTTLAADRRG